MGIQILPHKSTIAYKGRITLVALGVLLALCSCTYALDPSLDINQYAHTSWKVSDGFFKGLLRPITQTADGYLWIGTEFGPLRFDGVRSVPWEPPAGQYLRNSDIRSLLGARDGTLWIGTFTGLASWKDGKLTYYPELDGQVIEALLEDREGTIWVGGWAPSVGRLCKIQGGNTQCFGADGRFAAGVTAMYEDGRGNLWLGATNGLWRWQQPGPPLMYPIPDPENRIYSLAETDDGEILIAKTSGITKLRNGKTESYPLPAGLQFAPHKLLRDRHGGLWIGALRDRGLLHIHEGRTDSFSQPEGLSGESVNSIFEDREGNIWVATIDGLDRFREFAIPTFTDKQGFSSRGLFSILAGRDGSLWLGASNGVNRWNQGQITIYRNRGLGDANGSPVSGQTAGNGTTSPGSVRQITDAGLPDDSVYSIFEDHLGQIWIGTQIGVGFLKSDRFVPIASVPYGIVYGFAEDNSGNVWMSHQDGLFRMSGEQVLERISWTTLGRQQAANALVYDSSKGGLWLGFRDGGVGYFQNGQLGALYSPADGLGDGTVRGFYFDKKATLWVQTEGGLSRIKDGHVLTLTTKNGLPCNTVHWMIEDDAHSVWLYLSCGLMRISESELDAWDANPSKTIQGTVFDSSDGVANHQFEGGYSPFVAKSGDGKLWFLRVGGLSMIDPQHLPFNKTPPPVYVEQLIADGKTYDARQGLRLPPNVKDLAIDYTALSFVAPEKVQVRVILEGQDNDWRVPTNPRHAHYTNLGPGTYRFRVKASNNSGVWNEQGALLEFTVAPAFYQTAWFAIACGVLFIALLWLVYQLRVRQLALQFNRTFEARVSERTRIARELHDTLLQSFQGLLLRFQSVAKLLPDRPIEAEQRLHVALDQAAAAITEGRDAVQGLRSSALEMNELADGIKAIAEELTRDTAPADSPAIEVEIEGGPRNLNPIVRDEAYRIASEALRNAVRHAKAKRIMVEIRYDKRQFRLRVRDDGQGIDESIVQRQPSGHFGLPGMRERAEIVGGNLEVWTRLDSGTQVELTIPGAIAYDARGRKTAAMA